MAFKPNRDLLNVNFEGYKLSASAVTCLKCELGEQVHVSKLKDRDFSVHYMKALSLHNHLVSDPFDDNSVYWHARDGAIYKGSYVEESDTISSTVVYTNMPTPLEGSLNATLVFISNNLSLFSSGRTDVTLFYTGNRSENIKWEAVKTFPISKKCPVMIVAAAIFPANNSIIHVLCAELIDPSDPSPDDSAVAVYTWYSLKFKSPIDVIEQFGGDVIEGISPNTSFTSGSLALYVAFQFNSDDDSPYLLFMSETTPLISDLNTTVSDKPVTTNSPEKGTADAKDSAENSHFGLGYDTQGYNWSQTSSEVVLTIDLTNNVSKKEVDCIISTKELLVGLTDGTTFFRGELHSDIDTEGSTWTIENNRLEVTLEKKESGAHWPYVHRCEGERGHHHVLLSEGKEGDLTEEELGKVMAEDQSIPDKCEQPPDSKRPRPLSTSELEDCDTTSEDSTLFVIGQDGQLLQKASLSGRQLVFISQSLPGHAPHFALRHDVDAVVWLPPPITSVPPNEPSWTHVDSFNALGYVQASKENKKFTVSPGNLKFVVISDCNRHLFIYVQPSEGFVVNSAVEFVHTLSEKTDILGLAASRGGLIFVLTSNSLVALKIPM